MLRLIGNQFKRPTGFLGKIISKIMIKGNSQDYDKIIPELEIKRNDRILEIGYGHGLGVNRISTHYDCHITGIDFSELMFKEATKRNKIYIENKKVELNFGNFLAFEIGSDQFDKVFCVHVIYFWDILADPLAKINTVLKEGGAFCLFMAKTDYLKTMKFTKDGIFNKYSLDQVVDELRRAGFRDISHITNDKGYIIKCKK
ncbi:MAG: class I SAM-dependent methyltransferase [Bacteroidales bacterium]|nr:class I SAM-dependent methyltransferase [Bacteroidales bacterium]